MITRSAVVLAAMFALLLPAVPSRAARVRAGSCYYWGLACPSKEAPLHKGLRHVHRKQLREIMSASEAFDAAVAICCNL